MSNVNYRGKLNLDKVWHIFLKRKLEKLFVKAPMTGHFCSLMDITMVIVILIIIIMGECFNLNVCNSGVGKCIFKKTQFVLL